MENFSTKPKMPKNYLECIWALSPWVEHLYQPTQWQQQVHAWQSQFVMFATEGNLRLLAHKSSF